MQALRVKTAWKAFAGNELTPQMCEYLNSHPGPKRRVCSPRKKPSTKRARCGSVQELVPLVLPHEVVSWGCTNTVDGFRTTCFDNPMAFMTRGCVKVSVSALSDRRFSYRGTFEITHGLNGRPMRSSVKVVGPTLRTGRDKLDVGEVARDSVLVMSFNLYVRIMSRLRQNMLMDDLEIDTNLRFNPGHAIADPHIPHGVVEAFFPMERSVCEVVQQLCDLNSIHYVDPSILFNDSCSSDSDE